MSPKMTTEEANARALAIWRQRAEHAESERDLYRAALEEIVSGVYANGRNPRDVAHNALTQRRAAAKGGGT